MSQCRAVGTVQQSRKLREKPQYRNDNADGNNTGQQQFQDFTGSVQNFIGFFQYGVLPPLTTDSDINASLNVSIQKRQYIC